METDSGVFMVLAKSRKHVANVVNAERQWRQPFRAWELVTPMFVANVVNAERQWRPFIIIS